MDAETGRLRSVTRPRLFESPCVPRISTPRFTPRRIYLTTRRIGLVHRASARTRAPR